MAKKIKINKCPILEHMGESYEKITNRKVGNLFTTYIEYGRKEYRDYRNNIGTSYNVLEDGVFVGRARLKHVRWMDFIDIDIDAIHTDTFSDVGIAFFRDLVTEIYGDDDIPLIKLVFEWTEVA